MNRRQYLIGVGSGVSALPIVSHTGRATDHITVEITETNAPLEGGDLLDMAVFGAPDTLPDQLLVAVVAIGFTPKCELVAKG